MEVGEDVQQKLDAIAKLPKPARFGIIAAICVALLGGYYFMSYSGAREELAGLRDREMELQRKLGEVRSVAANMPAIQEEISRLEGNLSSALRQLPNRKQLEVLLTDISNLGKTSGVEIKSFKRNEEIVHDFYAEVPIAIQPEGRYHDIARFFDMMSKLPRIVNMGSIKMAVETENLDETRLRINGTATTFRFIGKKV